jgi:hypothetical protein
LQLFEVGFVVRENAANFVESKDALSATVLDSGFTFTVSSFAEKPKVVLRAVLVTLVLRWNLCGRKEKRGKEIGNAFLCQLSFLIQDSLSQTLPSRRLKLCSGGIGDAYFEVKFMRRARNRGKTPEGIGNALLSKLKLKISL